jgi:hypothetical protein
MGSISLSAGRVVLLQGDVLKACSKARLRSTVRFRLTKCSFYAVEVSKNAKDPAASRVCHPNLESTQLRLFQRDLSKVMLTMRSRNLSMLPGDVQHATNAAVLTDRWSSRHPQTRCAQIKARLPLGPAQAHPPSLARCAARA